MNFARITLLIAATTLIVLGIIYNILGVLLVNAASGEVVGSQESCRFDLENGKSLTFQLTMDNGNANAEAKSLRIHYKPNLFQQIEVMKFKSFTDLDNKRPMLNGETKEINVQEYCNLQDNEDGFYGFSIEEFAQLQINPETDEVKKTIFHDPIKVTELDELEELAGLE